MPTFFSMIMCKSLIQFCHLQSIVCDRCHYRCESSFSQYSKQLNLDGFKNFAILLLVKIRFSTSPLHGHACACGLTLRPKSTSCRGEVLIAVRKIDLNSIAHFIGEINTGEHNPVWL